MRVTRTKPRKSRNRRIPDPGAGIRRSEIRASNRAYVHRPGATPETKTPFGVFERAFSGEFEVEFEAFGIGTSTGIVSSAEGSLTLIGRGGVLHVSVTDPSEDSPPWIGTLRVDDIINIEPGKAYALSTGTGAADFLRIQTQGYRESLDQLSAPVPVTDAEPVHVQKQQMLPERVVRARKSSSPEHRAHIASLIEQDRRGVSERKTVTREVRQPRSADVVVPRHGQNFTDPATAAVSPGVNPRPLGAAAAAAMEAQAVRESMIPLAGEGSSGGTSE